MWLCSELTLYIIFLLQYYVDIFTVLCFLIYSCVLDWLWWCLFVKIEDFFLDFLLRFFSIIMFMFCSIVCMCSALNDSHYFFIFHRMLTATEQNVYFDCATCSFAQKVIVIN